MRRAARHVQRRRGVPGRPARSRTLSTQAHTGVPASLVRAGSSNGVVQATASIPAPGDATRTHRQRAQSLRKLLKRDRGLACQLNQSRREWITAEGVAIDCRPARTSGEAERWDAPDHDNLPRAFENLTLTTGPRAPLVLELFADFCFATFTGFDVSRPSLVNRKHPLDLLEIGRFGKSEHEQDARLLRVEVVGRDHSHAVIDVAADDPAVAEPAGADQDRPGCSRQ